MMKAAIYARVSTPDQCVENQLYELRELAARRGFEVVQEYTDRSISGSKSRGRDQFEKPKQQQG
jgi:DNA invertase Pin-like site-specific DNA recombinase